MRQFFNGLRLIYPGENDFIDQIKLKLSERNDLGDAPKAQWNNLEKCLDEDETAERHHAMALACLEGGIE